MTGGVYVKNPHHARWSKFNQPLTPEQLQVQRELERVAEKMNRRQRRALVAKMRQRERRLSGGKSIPASKTTT